MSQTADVWVPIGLDAQVTAASSNPVFVEEVSLALWRGEAKADGSLPPVNVWDDRCPHRGMRLSHGFVKGETLCCIYHGWGYQSGDGQCVHIPAHPDLTPPKTIQAKTYASESRYGIVWTNLAENPQTSVPEAGADHDWEPVRSLYVARSRAHTESLIRQHDFGDGVQAEAAGDGIFLVRRPEAILMLAVQSVGPEKTGIHVVAAGDAIDPSVRSALASRMTVLRDAIEAATN